MKAHALQLLDEFAAAYARGERPDVAAFLERAGHEREHLGRLIDAYLQTTTPTAPDESAVVALRARLSGEPPLLALRKERAMTRDAVVDELIASQSWPAEKRAKVKGYYHQLEAGLLDASRVAPAVLEVIARLLHVRVRDFEGFRAAPLQADAVFLRVNESTRASAAPTASDPGEEDEIDRAFHFRR